ncbi:MAG: hypothetical protein ABIV50_01285 [Opitutus sp.]
MKTSWLVTAWMCAGLASVSTASGSDEPFFDGLGKYERTITTNSPLAQQYFNQGLRFLFGFNHSAAIRSFRAAVDADPNCAMAHWGIALASGPHINFPVVPPAAAELAWQELSLARKYSDNGTATEGALIAALATRYANPQPEDRRLLDEAYASAMRGVFESYPQDGDAGALFAESMLDLRPWDQWMADGKPQPGTEEVISALDAVLRAHPDHPFANHLYIHTIEASSQPERASAAADKLRHLQPGLAHNVHMPSHIDIRCGNWQLAVDGNLAAIEADQRYRTLVGPPKGMVAVYAAHNRHMLTYAAMMTGQSVLALNHIRQMVAEMPPEFVDEFAPFIDGLIAMPYEVLIRFGRWNEILCETEPAENLPLARALRHAARAVAHAAIGDLAHARTEQSEFDTAAKKVPAEVTVGNNPASTIISIASHMIGGEILYREGRVDEGLAELESAVDVEDTLRYDEPPGWILPVRHALGATLMSERRYEKAEQVYREDLKRLPNNGWSLLGLSRSLMAQGKAEIAKDYDEACRKIWSKSDVEIDSSCLCQSERRLTRAKP